jgi:hypothetical protein
MNPNVSKLFTLLGLLILLLNAMLGMWWKRRRCSTGCPSPLEAAGAAWSYEQSPSRLFLHVDLRILDGQPVVTHRWTMFGRMVRIFAPDMRPVVRIVRAPRLRLAVAPKDVRNRQHGSNDCH